MNQVSVQVSVFEKIEQMVRGYNESNLSHQRIIGKSFMPKEPCPLCGSQSPRIPVLEEMAEGYVPDPERNFPEIVIVYCANCGREILASRMARVLDKWHKAFRRKEVNAKHLRQFRNECEARASEITDAVS